MPQKASPGKINVCMDLAGRIHTLKNARTTLREARKKGTKKRNLAEAKALAQEVQVIIDSYVREFHPVQGSEQKDFNSSFWHKDFFDDTLLPPRKPLLKRISEEELNTPSHIFESQVKNSKHTFLDPKIIDFLHRNPKKIPDSWIKLVQTAQKDIAILFWGKVNSAETAPTEVRVLSLNRDGTIGKGKIGIRISGYKCYSAIMPR